MSGKTSRWPFFGNYEARYGRWALVGDLVYADLGTGADAPFGAAFRNAKVDTQLTLFSAYAGYAVVDQPRIRLEVGPGFRYNDVSMDIRLLSNAAPTRKFSHSETWLDPLLAARIWVDLSENWFGTAFADVGGFGLSGASDQAWQAYAGLGYRFNDTWTVQAGYRSLHIERALGGRDTTIEMAGPMIGLQASF